VAQRQECVVNLGQHRTEPRCDRRLIAIEKSGL
jgi:hypothetical protein